MGKRSLHRSSSDKTGKNARGFFHNNRRVIVSIVRVGLGEERSFAAGYDAIFGGGKGKGTVKKVVVAAKKSEAKTQPKKAPAKKAKKK